MSYSRSVIEVAERNSDGLLTPSQVLILLGQHDASLSEMLAELPAEEGDVWRSAEYVLAYLGY